MLRLRTRAAAAKPAWWREIRVAVKQADRLFSDEQVNVSIPGFASFSYAVVQPAASTRRNWVLFHSAVDVVLLYTRRTSFLPSAVMRRSTYVRTYVWMYAERDTLSCRTSPQRSLHRESEKLFRILRINPPSKHVSNTTTCRNIRKAL